MYKLNISPPTIIAALAFTVASLPVSAIPPLYHVTDLGTLGAGTFGTGINASGQVTGYSDLALPNVATHAFRTSGKGQSASITDLGTLGGQALVGSAADVSQGFGINSSGQVTGWSYLPGQFGNYDIHAFRTTATGLVSDSGADLGLFTGGSGAWGQGINTSGQVTGYAGLASGQHAFRTTATGKIGDPGADLGTLGGNSSWGNGINDNGQVTGYSYLSGNTSSHAFRTSATGLISDVGTDLGTLGGNSSQGLAINASGQVTGFSLLSDNHTTHAFRTSTTGLVSDAGTEIGTLGGNASYGAGINASGMVVGYSYLANNSSFSAFYYDSALYDINTILDGSGTGWYLKTAYSINDAGDITGEGIYQGQSHAYRLTAVSTPEPGTWMFFLSSASLLSLFTLRRKRN